MFKNVRNLSSRGAVDAPAPRHPNIKVLRHPKRLAKKVVLYCSGEGIAQFNWAPPLTYPPKTEPRRAKYIGKGCNWRGKPTFLNDSTQIMLKTRENIMNSFRNQRCFVYTCFSTGVR